MSGWGTWPAENYTHFTFDDYGIEHDAAVRCVDMLLDDERQFLQREPSTSGEEYDKRCRRADEFIAYVKRALTDADNGKYYPVPVKSRFTLFLEVILKYKDLTDDPRAIHGGLDRIVGYPRIDISTISAKLSNLSAQLQDNPTLQTSPELQSPPQYQSQSMQILPSEKTKAFDVEAQAQGTVQAVDEQALGEDKYKSLAPVSSWVPSSSWITSNYVNGPQLCLVVPRVVHFTSEIFYYASTGDIAGAAKLIGSGLASPCDISTNYGHTPLHYAVDRGHMELSRFLLQAGAKDYITDMEGNSVIELAWNKICSKRISSKESEELEAMFKKEDWFEERQFTTLHKVVLDLLTPSRSLEQELSISTKDTDTPDSEGRTPLSWAAESGNVDSLNTLLQYSASTSTKSTSGMTPLHYATRAPTSTCLHLLLQHGASVSAKNQWNQSPLNIASYTQNDASYIHPLLDHGADIHERDRYSSTALSCAIFMNNDITARCLIARGANITDPDQPGITAIHDAIDGNNHACISLLLEEGVNLSVIGADGETALHVLARRGDLRTLQIFQAADLEGLDPERKTDVGLTTWDLMRQRTDVSEQVFTGFRSLMAKVEGKDQCITYVDFPEKLDSNAGEVPNLIEVRVKEVLAD
ncbi:MAG: hypothetical protein Q9222_003383 [Ikaeria aurantiellina]